MEEKDFAVKTAEEILQTALRYQDGLLDNIWKEYQLSVIEKLVYPLYQRIILSSFYPNVMLWIRLLKEPHYETKVCRLIEFICEAYNS